MSRFKSIRNKINKKSSILVDEKLAALDKDLEKTGMLSEIMTTDNVLSSSEYVPPQDRIVSDVPNSSNIGGDGFTQNSAGSGTEGDAPNHSSISDLYNTDVGHPIYKSTSYEGVPSYGIVIGPSFGAGDSYGIIEGGNTYRQVLGGHLAGGTRGPNHYQGIYDSYIQTNQSSPGFYSQEQIDEALKNWQLSIQVNAILTEIGYDNSKFQITWKAWRRPILFEDLSSYPSYNHPTKGTIYLVPFSLLGLTNRYTSQEPRPETTTNPQRRGLEDEPIYPGPIENYFGLGRRGLDYIVKKYKTEDDMWDAMADFLQNTAGQDPADDPFPRKGTGMDDRWIGPPVDKADAGGDKTEIALPPAAILAAMAALGIAFKGAESAWKLYRKYKQQIDQKMKEMKAEQGMTASYEPEGDLLSEGIKLGLYEPEAMNVDLADIRKGVMPEYPKKPPAEMIDGYHEKSPLRPKPLENEPYVKISKADLIRNHRLKSSEADEMMNIINMINDHIKKHPEDLIHAQMRYPKDDPRLSELNWKMDQMLEAGEEYLDSNFKENKKLYKRATEHTLKNIKVTDPKYVQQKYDELRGTIKPKKTKLVGRLGKHLNKYESKSLFKHVNSKNFKKISERKLEKEKFLEKQEQERLDYINDINAEMDEFRSDWRKEISESDFTNITVGNKVGQTFQHTSGATITLDNIMSDPSDLPSQVTLDLGFGEKITVDAPSGNEYGIAGVTKPLDKKVMQKQSVKTAKEINDQLDASEKASESKSTRVPTETGDLGYKSTDEILADVGDQWTYPEYIDMMNKITIQFSDRAEPLEKLKQDYIKNNKDVPISIIDAIDAIVKAQAEAYNALDRAWERYNKVPDLPDDYNLDDNDILDKIATKGNVSTSKDMFDYYMDKFVDNPTDKSVNMNRIFKPHLNKLKGYLPEIEKLITVGQNRGDSLDKIQKDVNNYWDGSISPRMPLDLRNSLGNGSQVDVDKFLKTGNWQINKDFVFTEKDDFTGRDMGLLGILPSWYARAKSIQKGTRGDLSPYVNVPMKYNIIISGSKKKKKVNESTAFSKIKKIRNK